MKSRLHAIIRGSVQGVFFRATAISQAGRLGLRGWIRNNQDGSVEIVAEGERDRLEQLLSWCNRGPEGAAVERVESEWLEATGEFKEFKMAA
jgi:acylphosphatase